MPGRVYLLSSSLALLALACAACGTAAQRVVPRVATPVPTAVPLAAAAGASTPAPAAALQDMGRFVVAANGTVQASNRGAAVAMHLVPGDMIRPPAGMQWGPPPGVGINPQFYLAFATALAGQKLYVWVWTGGQGGRDAMFEQVDAGDYRAVRDGDVLIWANDDTQHEPALDHGIALDANGNLYLSAAPVPAAAVIVYSTGEQLDVSGAQRAGTLPVPDMGFIFTGCDNGICSLSYRGATALTPVAGRLECGATVDIVTDSYRLQYQWIDTGWLPPSQGTATPPDCTPKAHVDAGEPVGMTFAHWIVRAFSLGGEPLSVVATEDGTIYVGHATPRFSCPPCRGA